ncbi:flagellar biosynthesis anti-sigma factor FlgM [Acidocella aminolytica]|jgi:flagellar biosynthesis anti-sigma factor FlgM|uniref:Negative regulator of flagellin synthesis n=1 Tax=Acidocella aminolytica 101 = DSM 11237 TaxID=1120923 RepID=A0A0D6PE89_9PROT|nr:flagellar biosynthesis anti-sigma factor FlgM [Acidocella aminolytica]GAN79992.1 hypothetical protein Aam_034_136 [Acidocella aminolytica 101 = DSM 11237]GBQ35552.1 hypothetical protein AA11237_1002 [Acidocella aminolytica 101 = DSM 11237]SHE57521.1 anti-sigma-28 factor, FlgM family [Acidocella aminolytica 101 = DSM 11237]
MTNTIQPYGSFSPLQASSTATPVAASPAPTSAQSLQAGQTETVTLSTAAQTNAALVSAAHGSSGVSQTKVSAIKEALANGSYNVSPENLAKAIATVLNEAG